MNAQVEVLDLLATAGRAVQAAALNEASRVVLDLLDRLASLVDHHGCETANATLSLVPMALAKGDSKRQLDEWVSRTDRGLPSGVFITYDPANKRFPTSVTETGRLMLPMLGRAS